MMDAPREIIEDRMALFPKEGLSLSLYFLLNLCYNESNVLLYLASLPSL